MANSTQLRGVAREVIHAESVTFWLERPNDSRVRVHVPPTSAQNLVEGEEVEVVGDFNVDGEFHAFSVERLTQPATRRPRIPSWGVYALAAASIAIVVLAGYLVLNRNRVPPLGPANGTLRGFRDLSVSEVSPSEVSVSIEYTYAGDQGEDPPIVPLVQGNGQTNTAMVYEYIGARAKVGTGKASWRIFGDLPSPWESDELRFCIIDPSRAKPPFCENFPYTKRWAALARPDVADNQIGSFQAQDVSGKELSVTVTYRYSGESGQRPFRVYMSAVALQSDKRQVPRTHFEGLGGPGPVRLGVGRSTMVITKSSDEAANSDSVRVCINSQNDRGNLTTVLCEEFPHRKEWK